MSAPDDSDIVERLRAVVDYYGCDPGVPMSVVDDCAEAATVIDRLRVVADAAKALRADELKYARDPGPIGEWVTAYDRLIDAVDALVAAGSVAPDNTRP